MIVCLRVNLHVNIIIVVAMLSQWWFRISEEERGQLRE